MLIMRPVRTLRAAARVPAFRASLVTALVVQVRMSVIVLTFINQLQEQ
jgi:hypothetical protein